MRVLLLGVLLLTGCAYAFTYGGGGPERSNADVYVQAFVDQSADGRVAPMVTDRLRARLGVVNEGDARYALEGEILGMTGGNLPVARPDGVSAGIAVIRVQGRGRLRDRTGRVVFDTGIREGAAELVLGRSVSESEDMFRLGLARASEALADELADAVMNR